VDGIDQVRNQFAIAVGAEVVTPVLQLAAQGCVVVDVPTMQNSHARACAGFGVGALTELGLGRVQKPKGRQLTVQSHLRVGVHEGSPFLQGQGHKLLARPGFCRAMVCRNGVLSDLALSSSPESVFSTVVQRTHEQKRSHFFVRSKSGDALGVCSVFEPQGVGPLVYANRSFDQSTRLFQSPSMGPWHSLQWLQWPR
jgi:hypothetical protein